MTRIEGSIPSPPEFNNPKEEEGNEKKSSSKGKQSL
jgi:hypothetical protein